MYSTRHPRTHDPLSGILCEEPSGRGAAAAPEGPEGQGAAWDEVLLEDFSLVEAPPSWEAMIKATIPVSTPQRPDPEDGEETEGSEQRGTSDEESDDDDNNNSSGDAGCAASASCSAGGGGGPDGSGVPPPAALSSDKPSHPTTRAPTAGRDPPAQTSAAAAGATTAPANTTSAAPGAPVAATAGIVDPAEPSATRGLAAKPAAAPQLAARWPDFARRRGAGVTSERQHLLARRRTATKRPPSPDTTQPTPVPSPAPFSTTPSASTKSKTNSELKAFQLLLERTRAFDRLVLKLVFGFFSLMLGGVAWVAFTLGRLQAELAAAQQQVGGLRNELQVVDTRWQRAHAALVRDMHEQQQLLLALPPRRHEEPGCVIC
ncbi:hypothetical protein VOLCADRAFT_93035 [Volvox carteri f. nagariensis]|uniref:Uncharacterized protein n=1 Tax=Volvox carteri f. nagariensis TaxID=3068 RepID=D8U163_VOLCA|nr:uncharacterized protein VOLCADRAFT_93035 [Volvox carteri f. nagariensis]EFJ46577.1 hypothetical protein VOLCADRAFT_93035 [Volvox carteri f. nagariensis]|eukprot:XP_002952434.1 hypothetical protein VOLCADRAFT_93035 [Volvox carteri f. nagariensis]